MKMLHSENLVPTDMKNFLDFGHLKTPPAAMELPRKKLFFVFNSVGVPIHWSNSLISFLFIGFFVATFLACGSSEIKPVDIYPEDMCSQCRMAVSDQAFASEIITADGEVFKFDDLGCLERFKEKSSDRKIAATFVKDYETKKWLPYERSTIVQTSIKTPMGSGKVAFADSSRAKEYLKKFPVVN